MAPRELSSVGQQAQEQVLGYVNFSSGPADATFLINLNLLFEELGCQQAEQSWVPLQESLVSGIEQLREESQAFKDVRQAVAVLACAFEHVIPEYFRFHHNLLNHQRPNKIMNSFMLGYVIQAVLHAGPDWADAKQVAATAIKELNDFVGYRPIPSLESKKIDIHPHEFVRPVPLYIRDVGVVCGAHRGVIETALELLRNTPSDILRAAHFDPELLDELCYDPRAYDFEHPVNKRPNYHFGLWDPRTLDNQGRYRRFVVQEVTLDALMARLTIDEDIPQSELDFEAASVLAGTILMASGISGSGPDSHDSTVTLSNLLPRIAQFRDAFYESLYGRMDGDHAERLAAESARLLQPFGGARQHLNTYLARRRASQVEHVHLSRIFAKMGHFEAAQRQADVVPVASARMRCRIDCLLTAGHQSLQGGDPQAAGERAVEVVELLHAAIECGAMIDPWNILGFDTNFSVFQALENSFHDHRADELIELVEQIFAFFSRIWSAAAANDDEKLCQFIDQQYLALAQWWHQYAVHEVTSVEAADSMALYGASKHVAEALGLFHQGGAATGDIKFWSQHAVLFNTAQSHALVTSALLDRGDHVASMGLLVHWLSQAESIPLEQSEHSFHRLSRRWLQEVQAGEAPQSDASQPSWHLVQKFLDYIEANAGDYWRVPEFELAQGEKAKDDGQNTEDPFYADGESGEEEEDAESLFDAAYEDVTYRDSTDDGIEGSTFDVDDQPHSELINEANRIAGRLEFLSCVANLWRIAIVLPNNGSSTNVDFVDSVRGKLPAVKQWVAHILSIRKQLEKLVSQILAYRLPTPSFPNDAFSGYDHHFVIESLLERVVTTSVEIADAGRILLSAIQLQDEHGESLETWNLEPDEAHWTRVFAGVLQNSPAIVKQHFPDFIASIEAQPLLYVPLGKGGSARQIVAARIRQRYIQDLLVCLPRLGLFLETCELIEAARAMERNNLVGAGAVTEFDELYKIGYRALVSCLVSTAETWDMGEDGVEERETALVNCLEQLTESLLIVWLAHSRTLRLSVLERVSDRGSWEKLIEFISKYGGDLFTQRFLSMGNLRAVLHQGVEQWLEHLQQEDLDADDEILLVSKLDSDIPRSEAADQLSLVIEAIVENYAEYRDYNSTTTQSDRGDLLYSLLDFLRLRTQYDRVCWNLKPVIVAHAILERRGHTDAARTWRRALVDRVREQADEFINRLGKLQHKYAMKMPTVADRIGERFVRPLAIDRIRALVEPAMEEATKKKRPRFELLEHETEALTREPSGVGLDIPAWIVALDDEVDRTLSPVYEREERFDLEAIMPPLRMNYEDLQQQLDDWTSRSDE